MTWHAKGHRDPILGFADFFPSIGIGPVLNPHSAAKNPTPLACMDFAIFVKFGNRPFALHPTFKDGVFILNVRVDFGHSHITHP